MSVLVGEDTRVLVQGLGKQGRFHAGKMIEYGTKLVAGVKPGSAGTKILDIPMFNTCETAVRETGADTSIIFVPAAYTADAILEAADSGIRLVVCITEGIPILDMVKVHRALDGFDTRLIGPNCPGIISPGKTKIGIMPASIHKKGNIGVMSRSGTLTYEVVAQLTALGLGQSTCIGLGGDPLPGTSFVDGLELFQQDPDTHGVVMIGEIGGSGEEEAAEFIKAGGFTKPVAAFIAGRTAPPGKRMGHAGAIISGGKGTAEAKVRALKEAAVEVADSPALIGHAMKRVMEARQ
ncbi:MAG: succinate--CoA ligase subunit alpha [Deltaproteobacteria bacterium]|nr:succinate--CoA ligase subunit alpha [Deltaproteobacteria bacterium]